MIYLLIAVFVLMWSLFIYHAINDKRLEGFFFKGFTSLLFLIVFGYSVFQFITDTGFAPINLILEFRYVYLVIFMMLGLVSGLVGDLFLEVQWFYHQRRNYMIKQGMVIFLIGHVFYIFAINAFVGFSYISLIVGLVMTSVVYLGSKVMKLDFQNLKVMTYIYTFVIFTMVGMAVYQAFELSFNLYSISFMVGAILFGISDLLLAPIYFKENTSKAFVVANLGTYYMAQLLIALSIMFL